MIVEILFNKFIDIPDFVFFVQGNLGIFVEFWNKNKYGRI